MALIAECESTGMVKTLNKLPTDVDTVGAGQVLHPDHTTSRFSMELLLPSEVVCFLFIQQTTAFVPAKTQKTEPSETVERKEPRETGV